MSGSQTSPTTSHHDSFEKFFIVMDNLLIEQSIIPDGKHCGVIATEQGASRN
jgi:hypothetical protein